MPSPQNKTFLPCLVNSLMYSCLSAGRHPARTFSWGMSSLMATELTLAAWSPLRIDTSIPRARREVITGRASGRRVSVRVNTANNCLSEVTQKVARPFLRIGSTTESFSKPNQRGLPPEIRRPFHEPLMPFPTTTSSLSTPVLGCTPSFWS